MEFESFLKEVVSEIQLGNDKIQKKKIIIEFEIDWNKNIGKVKQEVLLAMSKDSTGLFKLSKDIEEFSGLTLKEAEKYKETPNDAYVYGLCNTMNGGKDLFFWTNGTRLSGAAKKSGVLEAIIEQIAHECVHLSRLILSKHVFEKDHMDKWYTKDLIISDKKGRNIIDEEAFATVEGLVSEQIFSYFLEMAKYYIPELKKIDLNEAKNLTGLKRWFKEKWVDISRKVKGKHPECGRSDADKGAYPKCRPKHKVNSKTPKVASSFSKEEKQSMVKDKRAVEKNPRTDKKPHYTTHKESEEMDINETKLCAKGKAAAKAKFDVYPSAYSNAFGVKVCKGQVKGLDGKKSVASGYQKKKGKPKMVELFEKIKLKLASGSIINESYQWVLKEATYKGKKVTLNRPFRQAAAGKKFAVYVKSSSGNVKKVRFGAQGYRVRNANKAAASNFQKRHNCDQKNDKTKAGYWACRVHLYSSLKLASSRTW
jgi:hypothetical protein